MPPSAPPPEDLSLLCLRSSVKSDLREAVGPKGIELQGIKVISLLPREYVPLEILRQMRVRTSFTHTETLYTYVCLDMHVDRKSVGSLRKEAGPDLALHS
jgi:hypothetical protein